MKRRSSVGCSPWIWSPQSAAFTLIEIMVVVGIIGIVLVMGAPPFVRSLQKDALRQATSDIEEACSKARALAILQGVPMQLVLRANDGQLTVTPAPEPGLRRTAPEEGPDNSVAAAGPAAPVFSAQLQRDVAVTLLYVNLKNQMEAEVSRVHFYPNGTSDEFTIVLETNRGVRRISLESVTGLADVEVIR